MATKNENLNRAKEKQDDEFFTLYSDINKEVSRYSESLKGKVIYTNCSNYLVSNFYRFFKFNFQNLGLKKLICTGRKCKGVIFDGINETKIEESDIGFQDKKYRQYLEEAEIIIDNPPFSIFGQYFKLLQDYGKRFLIIGNLNAVSYSEVFPSIMSDQVWTGFSQVHKFINPDGEIKHFGNIIWFSNLLPRPQNDFNLSATYDPEKYPLYDNQQAIEVSRVKDIPLDYLGIMGVPITYIQKHNPKQFEIVGQDNNPYIQGKRIYKRILIQRKTENPEIQTPKTDHAEKNFIHFTQ